VFYHWLKTRHATGSVVRTVATSGLIDALARISAST
jgi:hypothetical protein